VVDMAIFKATYTNKATSAKANIRYIEHRPGKDNAKITRTLWGVDGKMERGEAYRMIDEAGPRSLFFRFIISPDPAREDTERDIFLREITEQTMLGLEDRVRTHIQWVAATHDDHAPHRHVHIMAILPKKLQVHDLQALRQIATEAALFQRNACDLAREHQQQERREREEAEWDLQR
jgi:hypothetical protein